MFQRIPKFISTSKETLKLLFICRIILSSNKIYQLLQKQQLLNYFVKKLNNKQLYFLYFTSSSHSNCSYFYVLIIISNIAITID